MEGPGPQIVDIIVHHCSTRVCYTRKMLKETETEETISFLATFNHWWHFNLEASLPVPFGYAYK